MTEPELPGIPEKPLTFEDELVTLCHKYRNGNLLGQSICLARAGQEALMRYVCDTPMQAMPRISVAPSEGPHPMDGERIPASPSGGVHQIGERPLTTPGGLGRARD